MDKKILAIIVVAIVAIAGVGGYLLLKDDKPSSDGTYAVSIDGVAATEDNVTNGTYEIQRNLIVCIKGELENAPEDVQHFLNYVTSTEGQAVLATEFVPITTEKAAPAAPDFEISLDISGSTTIEPIMNKLVEAYTAKYADAGVTISINVSGGGSGVGASNAASGESDIGMCSRDLKAEETAQGLSSVQIGRDGVAVIVNNAGVKNLTLEQVAKIYSGEITNWKELGGNDKAIAVIARDDASGTRECFDEKMEAALPGWEMKAGVPEHNSTGAVLTQVKNTEGAIGYVSIGALKDLNGPTGTYALDVNNVEANEDNVTNGTYEIQRNLIVCIKGELENAPYEVQNFLNYVTSEKGQAVLAEEFVPLGADQMTQTTAPTQDIILDISGSTTIEPIMNKLVEAYEAEYADAGFTIRITVSGGGSGVGASNAASGESDIGMCSRDLKDEETAQGLSSIQIGRDGVAVIVNNAGVENLTLEQIAKIYSGEITNWNQVGGNDKLIAVIARDDSSGTRECFDEKMGEALEGWEMKAGVPEQNSTGAVLTQVQNTEGAIGYVSIGALKDL